MVNIAVIDDGVNEAVYPVGELAYSIEVTPELKVENRGTHNIFEPSHGTTCAAIIKKYYADGVFSSVKVLNDHSGKGMAAQLVQGIRWCLEKEVQVISLSLGTVDYRDFGELEKVVNTAFEKGIILVAACNNKDIYTCPASLAKVIGVKSSKSVRLKEGEYLYHRDPLDGIEVTGCCEHKLTAMTGEETITPLCNSFAAPMITAEVCRIMENYPGIPLEKLKQELCKSAVNHAGDTANMGRDKGKGLLKRGIDVPLILIYGYEGGRMQELLEAFQQSFREEGYYAVGVCGQEGAALRGLHSMAVHNDERPESLKNNLERIYKVYDCDLLLLGLEINEGNTDYVRQVERILKPDISIFAANKYEQEIEGIVSQRSKKETFIMTLPKYINSFRSAGFETFEYKELTVLYKQILTLLQ